jgi:hypothetical protein
MQGLIRGFTDAGQDVVWTARGTPLARPCARPSAGPDRRAFTRAGLLRASPCGGSRGSGRVTSLRSVRATSRRIPGGRPPGGLFRIVTRASLVITRSTSLVGELVLVDEDPRDEEHAEDVSRRATRAWAVARPCAAPGRAAARAPAVVHGGRELLAERIGARVEEIDPARMPRAHPGEASASVG